MTGKLLKAIRGKDHRAAFKAIAGLRPGVDAGAFQAKGKDGQRNFQLQAARTVAAQGVAGLAREWASLTPEE